MSPANPIQYQRNSGKAAAVMFIGLCVTLILLSWIFISSLSTEESDTTTEPAPFLSAPESLSLVQPRLVSDRSTICAGQPFTLGIYFEIKPGWHIYWKHPGDAGLASRAPLILPEGFKASPLQFPLPERFVQPGNITGYGYTEAVMLCVEIQPPADLPPGQTLSFMAKPDWLACAGQCIPGRATLEIILNTGTAALPGPEHELLEKWRSKLPLPADHPEAPFQSKINLNQSPDGKEGNLHITLNWRFKPRRVEIFPVPPPEGIFKIRRIRTQDRQTVIEVDFPKAEGVSKEAFPELLITYFHTDGQRRGVVLPIDFRH